MSSRVTLGGERLGSGNKMKVDLHGFERSTFDLSYIWRSTMSAGTLVPFLKEVALPGDTFDIHLNCDIKTHPTVGPLFGSYKVQLDVFSVPIRLYHSALHNNRLGIGMNMSQIKLPKFYLTANPISTSALNDLDNSQINPSCIMSYLGIRGVSTVSTAETEAANRYFNAVPFLAYWDIYKQYYANKQEEIGYVISNSLLPVTATVNSILAGGDTIPQIPASAAVAITGYEQFIISYTGSLPNLWNVMVFTGKNGNTPIPLASLFSNAPTNDASNMYGIYDYAKYGNDIIYGWRYLVASDVVTIKPTLNEFTLSNIDLMRDKILAKAWNSEFLVNTDASTLEPYRNVLQTGTLGSDFYASTMYNQEGLGIKTYQSDMLNNWLSTEWIDGTGGINEITAIDTSGGSFNIDTLNLSKKVYDMLNRIAVSGGTYNDWISAAYDQDVWNRAESPVYCGGLIKELVFQEVVSNSESESGQPLGTLAGKGVMSNKHKGGTVVIKVTEPSYIMGIVSLTPRIDYSQGNKWDIHLQTMDDFHKPNLDQIGFQESINEQRAWWSTKKEFSAPVYTQTSAGKVPAWLNYMTNVNEVRGNFAIASNEMFMVLNRRYEPIQTGDGDIDIKDLTTYIDPSKFNHIFADTSLDAQNFWTQISIDMTARRKMSSKVMPNV